MGTTAEKLTYLGVTKEKIRDSINLTGANLTSEDTFRSYASKLKKGYIDIINNGIDTLYNNFPKVSGIGSNLSLTPTYEAPMKLNEIQGDTLQDGTPTPDTPVEIQSVTGLQNVEVCGKNLFDINGTVTQGTLDKYNNGFTLVKGTNRVIRFVLPKVLPAGTYTLSYDTINVENVSGNYFYVSCQYTNTNIGILSDIILNDSGATFTTTGEFDRLYFFIAGNQSNDATITIDNIQLEQGSTATEYEPYKGNTYEVNLGKNLLDIPDGTYSNNGITAVSSNGIITLNGTATNTSFIVITLLKEIVAANQTLTISNNNQENISDNLTEARLFTTVGDYIPCSFKQINNSTTRTNLTGTYNRLQIRTSSGVSFNNFVIKPMLEKGSQATSYSPYFTPIELNKIGTYKDRIYKDNGKWYLEKNIGKVVLNGSEGWFDWNNNRMVLVTLTDYKKVDSSTTSLLMSNYYKAVSRANSQTNNSMCFYGSSDDSFGIIVCDGTNNTSTLLKAWLSTHNTEVLYVLNTPTYTEITNTELIEDLETLYTAKSQEGTTNISITSEDLEMILNVSALKSE